VRAKAVPRHRATSHVIPSARDTTPKRPSCLEVSCVSGVARSASLIANGPSAVSKPVLDPAEHPE
jgi:hypothetical protein